jgi:hypothetical protein
VFLGRQRRQELRDLVLTHLQGMALAMEEDKPLDPTDVCFLGPHAVVPCPDDLTDLVKQLASSRFGSMSYPGDALE